ncbi:hypothetical protein ACFVU3_19775 [Streptomyces sp. NPDC058052]|uniref:hypothetical protein n=1 Tax=Streptomyces sp. NPDC058052 TaxID=3346316 RepID=UPI0036ED1723
MTRTTPPRPLDVEALFPELAAFRGTTTRLHPRPGDPGPGDSSVGGPMLWPAEEPWPLCDEAHGRGRGRRTADIHRSRRILAASWARERSPGPTDEERDLLRELSRDHVIPGASETDPLPMVGLAQLYRRDVPDLAGPAGCDLLQVFWCPFPAHGPGRNELEIHLRWRRSGQVGDVLAAPPRPAVVGSDDLVPEPCALHPEQVVTYPDAGVLPAELRARIDAWEEALEEEAGRPADGRATTPPPGYQYDLSIPPGWRVGGFASWHRTDPYPMDCLVCGTPMRLLLTVDSSEWDGGSGSWKPVEDRDLPTHRYAAPTHVIAGSSRELHVFVCAGEPTHPHRWCFQ